MKLIAFIALIGVALLSACSFYLTDREMVKSLQTNEHEFYLLVNMIKEDSYLWEVNQEHAKLTWDTKVDLPSGRMNEYRRLLTKLGVTKVWRNERSGEIFLTAWHRPGLMMGIGGSTKFYVYSESRPNRIVDSLDNLVSSGQDASDFMPVQGNWYLFLDVW